ncbi:twin transmembrane helix small protein [Sphingobium sufflavum]|uniref:twin transmembrane helix small protein n=1 Tax=Sphingobium sufflavum TaxID=1129547 RepID=UPI001F2E8D03|nr:twin transmembrane helix small protein [Sphingobium sufflavum]MCE7797582.1 twin transmembrane helix small protein [Sphingobium sufflavum]
MTVFLTILIILAALATLFMFIRGLVTFLKTTEAELNSTDTGPSPSSLKQNKMMMGRIAFQAIAILFVAALLLLNSGK